MSLTDFHYGGASGPSQSFVDHGMLYIFKGITKTFPHDQKTYLLSFLPTYLHPLKKDPVAFQTFDQRDEVAPTHVATYLSFLENWKTPFPGLRIF